MFIRYYNVNYESIVTLPIVFIIYDLSLISLTDAYNNDQHKLNVLFEIRK